MSKQKTHVRMIKGTAKMCGGGIKRPTSKKK
jgi:hypothetical protein